MTDSNTSTSTNSENELILVKDRYKIIKTLGRGSYGEVWLVSPLESSTGSRSRPRKCVLKRVNLARSNDEKNELAAAEREAQLLSSLKHPNIVAYIESFRSRDRHLNIVMAFCEGGDLYTKIKYRKKQLLNEEQIVDWFIQITLALNYMHEKSILHRDLKTQNIFLTRYDIVKIGDLGIARILENNGSDLATTVIGTPYYMSPEIFSNQPYGQKSDIWSLGCCVYEMATLEHAFSAGDISSLVLKVVRGQTPTIPSANVYSTQLIELINAMLDKDANNRPSAKQILQNSYIKQHISRLYNKTKETCKKNDPNVSTSSSLVVATSNENDHHSMPPLPRPRSAHLPPTDESSDDKTHSSVPSLSQSRLRRLQQKTTSTLHNELTPPSNPSNENDENDSDVVNNSFIARIRENDTLARYKRESSSPNSRNQTDELNNSRLSSTARQRRREEQRLHPTISPKEEEHIPSSPATPPIYDRSISNDSQIDAIEQERKAQRDIKDFLNQLDATLRLPSICSTLTENSLICDRTMVSTSNLEEIRNALREACLKEMSVKQLDQALELLDHVSDTRIQSKMIAMLGEEIFDKCGQQIYSLKYYEDSIHTRL